MKLAKRQLKALASRPGEWLSNIPRAISRTTGPACSPRSWQQSKARGTVFQKEKLNFRAARQLKGVPSYGNAKPRLDSSVEDIDKMS